MGLHLRTQRNTIARNTEVKILTTYSPASQDSCIIPKHCNTEPSDVDIKRISYDPKHDDDSRFTGSPWLGFVPPLLPFPHRLLRRFLKDSAALMFRRRLVMSGHSKFIQQCVSAGNKMMKSIKKQRGRFPVQLRLGVITQIVSAEETAPGLPLRRCDSELKLG